MSYRPLLAATALALLLAPVACDDAGGGAPTADTDAVIQDTAETADSADSADSAPADTTADTSRPAPQVVINEVHVSGDDWIELYNAGAATADLSGWLLRDSDPTHAYLFTSGTLLPAGVYLLLERDPEVDFDFGLGAADSALLYDGDALIDAISWVAGEIPEDLSYGRFPNGTGPFGVRFTPTPGAANQDNPAIACDNGTLEPTEVCDGGDFGGLSCESLGWQGGSLSCDDGCQAVGVSGCTPRDPALVINEVTSSGDDRIELFNHTEAAIDLSGWQLSDSDGNAWAFPAGSVLDADERRVLVKGVDHDFGLGRDDAVFLHDAQGQLVDETDWPSDAAAISWCRSPDGVGGFAICAVASFGEPNPAAASPE